jgi:hypothetical protein
MMKTLAEHAAVLRKVAGEHFNYTIPASGPTVETHDAICAAADALDAAHDLIDGNEAPQTYCIECGVWMDSSTGEILHKADCRLAALIGAKVAP